MASLTTAEGRAFGDRILLTKGRNGEILSTGFCVADFVDAPEPIFDYAQQLSRIRAGAGKTVQNLANSVGPATS